MNGIAEIAIQTLFFTLIFGGGAFLYQWFKAKEKKETGQRVTPEVPVEKLIAANTERKTKFEMKLVQRAILGVGVFIVGVLLTIGFLEEFADELYFDLNDTWGYWIFSISALTWFEIWLFRK